MFSRLLILLDEDKQFFKKEINLVNIKKIKETLDKVIFRCTQN